VGQLVHKIKGAKGDSFRGGNNFYFGFEKKHWEAKQVSHAAGKGAVSWTSSERGYRTGGRKGGGGMEKEEHA